MEFIDVCFAQIRHDFPTENVILAGDVNQLPDWHIAERNGLHPQWPIEAFLLNASYKIDNHHHHQLKLYTSQPAAISWNSTCPARGLWRTTRHTDKPAALHRSRLPAD